MIKYGRSLVQKLPEETTLLLITLCTDWPIGRDPTPQPTTPGAISGPPGNYILIINWFIC